MMAIGNSNAVHLTAKQAFPSDCVSQRLVEAANANEVTTALECLADPFVDVNHVGTVSLRSKKTEIVSQGELAHQVRVEYDEFRTDVTALFLAAHSGNLELVRKLISVGANLNQKLFRGYEVTAAVREGHTQVLEAMISCGASQPACEEALVEASYLGRAIEAEVLMASDMIRPQVAVHALVSAASRGFADVVNSLIKSGVDANANGRLLLQSSKPSLYTSVNCNALVAAIVGRHINVVNLLLQAGVRTDLKVNLGAWSWDKDTNAGEEFRVGAGLAEAYGVAWCAVEYFEASGAILRLILQQVTGNVPHFGRTLIHHAILCNNAKAVEVLINYGAVLEVERPVFRAIHLAAQLGSSDILEKLICNGCDVDSLTKFGETAMMICARCKFEEGIRILALVGADFGLVNDCGESIVMMADLVNWGVEFRRVVLGVIRDGGRIRSSNKEVFSPLIFVARENDVGVMKLLFKKEENIDLDQKDRDGFSAIMVAAANGNIEMFELLLKKGANLNLRNKFGKTALSLYETNQNRDGFEKLILRRVLEAPRDTNISNFFALSCSIRRGDLNYIRKFFDIKGHNVNVNMVDDEGNTLLMVAAREGQAKVCKLLISLGALCDFGNAKGETALSLSRSKGITINEVERVILDEVARKLVLQGSHVIKHTRGGRGAPHGKLLRMVGDNGVLRWGESKKRNVVCKTTEVGPSDNFVWNRRREFDAHAPGLFHVVTTKNKEVHFVCEGGEEMAKLWVRGIRLVTRDATFCKNNHYY